MERIYVDLLPLSQAIVQGTPPMADTSAPATKKKVPCKLGTIGGQLLPCTCATSTFLAERRLKLRRAADADEQKLEADIFLAECRMKKNRAADAENKNHAADADENKCATDAEEKTKRAADDDEKKPAAGSEK
jgi:hypothetical protein